MHVIQDNYCIRAIFLYLCTVLEEKLHCHSSRTANGKLTTKKERKKENEKGSLENYLADAHRSTHRYRHYPRRYQLHVD